MQRKRQRITRSPSAIEIRSEEASIDTVFVNRSDLDHDENEREITPDPLDQYDATTPVDHMAADIRDQISLYRDNDTKKQRFPEHVIIHSFFGKFMSSESQSPATNSVFSIVSKIYVAFFGYADSPYNSAILCTVQLSREDYDRLLSVFFEIALRSLPGKVAAPLCQRLRDYYTCGN